MTNEDRLLLNELKTNLEHLFQSFNELGTANKMLEDQVAVLKQNIKALEQEKAFLVQKNEKMKFANLILTGSDENSEAKKKINRIIREIDKCVALLNK